MEKRRGDLITHTVYDEETGTIPVCTITMAYIPELDDVDPRLPKVSLLVFDVNEKAPE